MSFHKPFFAIFILCVCVFTGTVYAVEPLPDNLIALDSPAGEKILAGHVHDNTLRLLEQFTTQKTTTYCGVASAVMVLNASDIPAPVTPEYAPYAYFTQDAFFTDKVSAIIKPEVVARQGMTLTELASAISTYGLNATPYPAQKMDVKAFKKIAITALAEDQFVIVNFLRTQLQQAGGGHHSPIAAYDKKTDRFLMLDVARYRYPSYWVKTEDLWNAMNTMDGEHYSRGLIVIAR